MKKVTLLTIAAIIILGLYVLPGVTARFAGSHTWELNRTGGASALQCGKCHQYIVDEAHLSGVVGNVTWQHRRASNESRYINASSILIKVPTPQGNEYDFCNMCHVVESGISYAGHTKVTIRVCTDGDCHGDHTNASNQSYKLGVYPTALNITQKIKASQDPHSKFYNGLATATSTYSEEGDSESAEASSGTYNAGFYACIGCHTRVGVQINITRPNIYKFNLSTTDGVSWSVDTAPTANNTNFTQVWSYGSSGSKWR